MTATTVSGLSQASAARLSLERREDEARLLAESALDGERAVSVLRIITWVLLGVAFSGAEATPHEHGPDSALHLVLIAGWFLFAVVVLIVLRRVRFTPARARLWPIGFMLVDNGVFVLLALTTHEKPQPEVSMATLAILLAYNVARFSSLQVWLGAALAIGGYMAEALGRGWFNWRVAVVAVASYACLATVVDWANRRVRHMFVEVRRRDNLARFLPRQVAARVLEAGGRPLAPVQREVTILFSDIRDFTTLSERMEPAMLLAFLDDYFARMSEIVKGRDGMVNKFIGDGMLAVWGVPDLLPDHARLAVLAALDMRRAVAELNGVRAQQGFAPLKIGVGLHTGVVAAGMLGGPDQHEYTVIGDAVNVASRVEGLTKRIGADVVITEATWKACGDAFATERVGSESVKGRNEEVVVYRVLGLRPPAEQSSPAPALLG